MAATSTVELGRRLGLEESPALVLHTAAKASEAEGVMIVDQLDAVRTMSGRGTEVFDVVEKLLIEAEDCSIATLVVCRAFDWQHDPRLRSLIRDERRRFELGQLSPDDVQHALNKAGFNDGSFGSRQLDLLRVPQNLSLFLNSNSPRSPTFSTVGDLLERYWDQKREQVHARAQGEGDLWPEVLGAMCRAMNKTQQLTVRRERLDHYSPSYLHQLVSEGVLAREGEEYAFGHESFFDYCFARLFANNAQSLTELLRSSEQHLFRRSQVRQVLAYLRDADFDRYLRELRSLVLDPGVRAHVKDLAFALLAGVEEPYDKEWEIWEACFGTQLVAFGKETTASDPLRRLAWNRLFGARSWFKQFGKRGVLDRSLREQEADDATHYLKRHQCSWPDEVTDYLERFAGRGGAWLADVMLDVGSCGSRRYFELFLRLLANGTFDLTDDVGFRGGLSYVYYSLHGRDLQWVPELLAGQLLRLGSWFQAGVVSSEQPFDLLRDLPMEIIQDSARKAPSAFVSHVLPAMLDLADAASYKAQGLPFRDRMWPILVKNSPSEADACLETLAETIERLAGEGGLDGRWIGLLAARRTHIANHLLLAVYRGGSGRYADHAAQEFSRNPWRFDCGYSDSPYWCATEALAAVLPHCTEVAFARLEGMIVRYLSPYERTKEGASRRGEAAFNLLTAIPARRLSDSAKRRFQEMERKFGRRWSRPEGITGGIVGSPIPKESARRMSDEDWWNAMAKYGSASPADPAKRRHWRAGGAQELAHVLGEEAKAAPERFVDIGLGLPPDTNPMYYSGLLRALAGATLDDDAKLSFCRKVFQHAKTECGGDLADLLHTVSGPLPQDALDMLVALAVTPDGVEGEEEWRNEASDGRPFYGGDIYTNGINTTRGRAALAIGKLVVGDGTYVRRLEPSLHQLVGVGSASVASCVAYALRAVAYHDRDLGMALFLQMNFDEERLLATRHVREFIREHLHHGFRHMHELIGRMWRSVHPELRRSGARLGCMAAFHQEKARELVVPRGMWRTACMHMGRWTATALAMFF